MDSIVNWCAMRVPSRGVVINIMTTRADFCHYVLGMIEQISRSLASLTVSQDAIAPPPSMIGSMLL